MERKPKLALEKIFIDGKNAIQLIVYNADKNGDLLKICKELEINLEVGIANRRKIICKTAEQLDAARNPLVKFFDKKGDSI